MDDRIKAILIEAIDKALSSFDYVDKERFYRLLETKYGLGLDAVPQNYSVFHDALVKKFGSKHFAIEAKILRFLHEGYEHGVYGISDEVSVGVLLVESYLKEMGLRIEKAKRRLEKKKVQLESIKSKVKEEKRNSSEN
jgi:hypothetical protein